ncbi:ankyrin repeat domain-containing protein [Armatimonas sp.]|uniref:ankyrin repeat domain-containing protein n=1 Tax=Armatimonas sp. TaxID=1872638 RepID=UPI00286B499F|nr:ankyrin repeat domain-containing protein [Armatimonas sp.]
METKWTEEIHKTPQPESGVLTERALAQAPQKSRRTLRPYAYGSLALAATLPVAFLLLPKMSIQPQKVVALTQGKSMPTQEKSMPTQGKSMPTQGKSMPTQEKSMPTQEKSMPTQEKSMPTQEKSMPTQEKLLAEPEIATLGLQKHVVQENEEPLSRQARGGVAARGLSALSSSSNARGTQLAFAMGERLAEFEGVPLTPLPNAPTSENPLLKTILMRWPDGTVVGTLVLANNTKERGALPKAYLVYVAAFDAKGTLVSTAQTELPGAGGTATVKLGLAPTAQHYQLALFAKPTPPKEEMVVAGYLVRHLVGDVLPSSTSQITLHEPQFYESNYYKTLSANLSVSTVKLGDAAGYTVHGALFDEKGALLSTDQAPLKSPRIISVRPLQAEYSQEVSLGFGVTGRHAAHYQLAVTAPTPKPQNFRLGEYLVAQKQAIPATAARGLSVVLKPELSGLTPRVVITLPSDPETLSLHAIQTQQSLALEPQTARSRIELSRSNDPLNFTFSLSTLSKKPINAPDASFTVASVTTETDGSLLLLPPPCLSPMEEIFKNPKLRDYTQIRLTPSTVAALKAKGITEFVGRSIQASGKSESVLNLTRPAFEVTTVTVEKTEDLSVTQPPMASFTVVLVNPEEDGSLVLIPKTSVHSATEARLTQEILKNPELRDYTQVKLTPSVVAALKAKGITEFVGKSIQASGKSDNSLYLAYPAFKVTTITVEKTEDFQIGLPLVLKPIEPPQLPRLSTRPRLILGGESPETKVEVIRQLQGQDFLRQLRAAKNAQGRYELLISPEFNEILLAAAQRGEEATVIQLVQWSWFGGPDEAAKGGNGVTWAAYCPTIEPVKALLERGVPAGVADASGNTGLHRTYRPEIAELLLKHKALTETKNADGETPLLAQTRQADRWLGRRGVIQALLSAGANPNATDNQGRTPLMWAAKSGLPDFVEALLKKGADPKRKDKDGKTARDYIAAWPWGMAPGLLTPEGAAQLQRDSEADRARVEQLLGGR